MNGPSVSRWRTGANAPGKRGPSRFQPHALPVRHQSNARAVERQSGCRGLDRGRTPVDAEWPGTVDYQQQQAPGDRDVLEEHDHLYLITEVIVEDERGQ
jgi:hypothetical protein